MGSAVSAISDFAGSALGLGRSGNVSGQGYIDDLNSLASQNARSQMDITNALAPQQTAFGQQLADRAMGKAPSLAEVQMRTAQDRNLQQQLAAAKANRAVNPALASRQVQNLGAQGAQQIAQASAAAKLQEDAQNQMMFGNYLNQQQQNTNQALGRGQNAAESLFAAQMGKRNSDINMVGNIANQVGGAMAMMSDKSAKKDIKSASSKPEKPSKQNYAKGGLVAGGTYYQPQAGNLFGQFTKAQEDFNNPKDSSASANGFAGMLQQLMQSNPQGTMMAGGPMDSLGAIGGPEMAAAAPVMMASTGGKIPGPEIVKGDSERNDVVDAKLSAGELVIPKTVVSKGPDAVKKFAEKTDEQQFNPKSFLDALKPYSYKYKDASNGEGRHMSVMAQDLEKAGPVGRSMVSQTSQGKVVDYGKGFGAILAAQADLNERMKEIEARYGTKIKKDKEDV